MKAFEFSARMNDGVIEVPAYCVGQINPGDKVRVIVLVDGRDGGGFRPERRPFKKRFGGDRDGGRRDFNGYNSDRKRFKSRFDGDRDGGGKEFGDYNSDRKPFRKRFNEDRDGVFRSDKKQFKKRFDEIIPDMASSIDLE